MKWPENAAEAAVAMADGRERSGARETGTRHHETQVKRLGEVEGIMGSLTAGKIGVGDSSGKAGHGGWRTTVFGVLRAPVTASEVRARAKTGAGRCSRGRLGLGLRFVEAGARGRGAPTTRVERARLRPRLDRDGGCGRKVGELTGGGRASAAGRGRRRAATVGGRVGRRGLLGRTAEARDRAGAAAGLGCGAGPRGKKWPWGRKSRKRGKEEFFLFFFQTNFPKAFSIQISIRF